MRTKISLLIAVMGAGSMMLLPGFVPYRSEVEGKQLKAIMSVSNSTIRPGQRLTLLLDLELNPNVHVYGSGAKGYMPVEWKMGETSVARFEDPVYPKPETLFLPAVSDKAPVYSHRVELKRDIIMLSEAGARARPNGELAFEGTLSYQACDDKMCYFPQELPLKWILQLQGIDEKR